MKTSTILWAGASARAKRDHLSPIPCQRLDTSEAIWLVHSRNDPNRYYLLTVSGETIHCACTQAELHGICAHGVAVRLALQTESQQRVSSACPSHTQPPAPPASRLDPCSASQREQERQRRVEAARRERALLWTDDRPFSIWK